MNIKLKTVLLLSSVICLSSCIGESYPVNNTNNNSLLFSEIKNKNEGIIKLNVPGNLFSKGFSTKSSDFVNPLIRKLRVQIDAYDLPEPSINKTVSWTPGQPVSFSILVPAGLNRVVLLYALDAGNRVLGSYMGSLDVLPNQLNEAKISYFDTIVSQVLIGTYINYDIDSSENTSIPKEDYISHKISLSKLKEYVKNITGYNEATNSFNKISPSELNTSLIVNYLGEHNGEIPELDTFNKLELTKTGFVELDSNTIGSKVLISDLSSKSLTVTANQMKIENVSLGLWYLTIIKEGYVDQSFYINVTEEGSTVLADLPEDFRLKTNTKGFGSGKLKEPYVDEELKIALHEYNFTYGVDNDNNGAEDQTGEGDIEVEGFDTHVISLKQQNYPVMSNENDVLEVYDLEAPTGANNYLKFEADQELQSFKITDNENGVIFVETNFDKTWSFDGKVATTVQELALMLMGHPLMKKASIHSLAMMYTLQKNKGLLPELETTPTLLQVDCSQNARQVNNYNSYDIVVETLKQMIIIKKEF